MTTRPVRPLDARRRLLAGAKRRAEMAGLPFNLDLSDIIIPDRCPALGLPIELGHTAQNDHSPTLDRIIPALGYTRGNVIVVCWRTNRAKSNLAPHELAAIAAFYGGLFEDRTDGA